MDQNINATGTILVPAAAIKVDVFPITLYHTFSLGGRFAQFSVMVNPGSVSASAKKVPPIISLLTNQQNMLGGGLGAGYQITPFLGAYADYGTILAGGPNNARSNMILVAVNFTYVNLKKLKVSAAPAQARWTSHNSVLPVRP